MFFALDHIARRQIGRSLYRLKAPIESAPKEVDCSSFVKWLYAHVDITLPRLAREQYEVCCSYGCARDAQPCDLVFTNSHHQRFVVCPVLDIGHVGFVTHAYTIIHASYYKGVVEESLEDFFGQQCTVALSGSVFSKSISKGDWK